MKKIYFLIPLFALLLTACSKRDYYPSNGGGEADWVHTHDHGVVAFVDYSTGNYIVETYNGYTVVESWGGNTPVEYDDVYAYFSSRGNQSIYNLTGRYFTQGNIVDSWLSWSDAMYVLDDLKYGY